MPIIVAYLLLSHLATIPYVHWHKTQRGNENAGLGDASDSSTVATLVLSAGRWLATLRSYARMPLAIVLTVNFDSVGAEAFW
jgi:hypothetical protein